MTKLVPTAQFVKLHPDAVVPSYKTEEAACCDLSIIETLFIAPGELRMVKTGLVAIPPEGYHWHIYLRSSTPLKFQNLTLLNCVGIIDSDYCGPADELKLLLYNPNSNDRKGDNNIYIEKGDRVAQMRLVENVRPYRIVETPYEDIKNGRTRSGFGSTG